MISVIVPVYNSDRYLSECLDSLIHQTYRDLEIILVDDGSQDRSPDICEEYAQMDQRISVMRQENGGSTRARKAGLRAAKGEYIAFADSDDWIDESFFERLHDLMITNDVDMAVSGCRIEKEDGALDVGNAFEEGSYRKAELREKIYPRMLSCNAAGDFCFGITQYLWNKLYKREVIEPCIMELDERIYDGEDAACVFDACLHASGIYIDNHPYYHYRVHENSICTSKRDERYFVNAVRLNEYMSKVFSGSEESKVMLPQLRQFMSMFVNNGTSAILGFEYVRKHSSHMWKLPEIPGDARRICVFGAGRVGRSFYGQLLSCEDRDLVAWVDSAQQGTRIGGVSIQAPECILNLKWDLVIIAVKDECRAQEVLKWLEEKSVPGDKILWERPQRRSEGYELAFA